MDLLNLEPTKISRGLSGKYVLLYGPPKIGKTTMASQFENTLLLAFEQGYNAIDGIYAQPIYNWADMKAAQQQLCSNPKLKEKFKTIAIDTADLAWDMCESYICSLFDVTDLTDVPWGKAHAKLKKEFDTTFRSLTKAGYGIVFISHEQEKEVNEVVVDEKGKMVTKKVKKICPSLSDKARAIINKMVDIIGYIKQVRDVKGDIHRFILTRDSLSYEAGTRFKYLPNKIPLSYENLVTAVNEAIEKEALEKGSNLNENNFNPYDQDKTEEDYQNYLSKIKEKWETISNETKSSILSYIEKKLGRKAKISDLTPEQNDLLSEIVDMLK